MYCPCCKQSNTGVIDSRDLDATTIRRRRECSDCHYRFTTYERLEAIKLQVKKKDGTIEAYNREKLIQGITLATEKLPISSQVNELIDCIEQELLQLGVDPVPSEKIGQIVLKHLKKKDKVAYLRFSSVYKKFSTIKSFEQELAKLASKKTNQ